MDLAGYVINAVLVEGRSVKDVCEAHDISRSWLYELIGRYRELGDEGLRPVSKRPRSSPTRVGVSDRGRDRRRCAKSSPISASTPGAYTIHYHLTRRHRRAPGGAVGGHDLAGAVPAGLCHPAAPQAAQELVAAVPGRAAQRVLAGRHHPLGARRRQRRGDPQRHRRPLPPAGRVAGVRDRQAADVVETSISPPPTTACPRRCSPTTAPSSPPRRATGPAPSSSSCSRSASTTSTPAPTTPRPAGKSNASTRPSRNGSPSSRRPPTIAGLQAQLDRFATYYNTVRPHRALGRRTPAEAFAARTKATPRRAAITVPVRAPSPP